jgi:hypothetical protein
MLEFLSRSAGFAVGVAVGVILFAFGKAGVSWIVRTVKRRS